MRNRSVKQISIVLAAVAGLVAPVVQAQTTASSLVTTGLTASANDIQYSNPPIFFGAAVAIDGPIAMVGIPGYYALDAQGNVSTRGRVAVYTSSTAGGAWTRTASIQANDLAPGEDFFGNTLALQNGQLIVGSASLIRVFTDNKGVWTQTDTINTAGAPNFAFDGHYLITSTNATTGVPAGEYPLAIYNINASGQTQFLGNFSQKGSPAVPFALADGILALQGALSDGTPIVYVYSSQSATPTVPQVLTASDLTSGSGFGASVAVWNGHVLVGAPGEDQTISPPSYNVNAGAVYVFTASDGKWTQTQKVAPQGVNGFGTEIAVNEYGAMISAPYSPDNFATITGETQAYVWNNGQLVLGYTFAGAAGDSLAVSGTEAIIGTQQQAAQYGDLEYAEIVTLAPGTSTSQSASSSSGAALTPGR